MNDLILPLFGGVLIGLAATLLLVLHGRIAGISGILGATLTPNTYPEERRWRLLFLVGLVGMGGLLTLVTPASFATLPGSTIGRAAIAGLLVGYGTRLGSGCTSGHGVCGMSRLSIRSVAATGTFIVTGALTVFLLRQTGVLS